MNTFIKHNAVHIGGVLGILTGIFGLATGNIPATEATQAIMTGVAAILLGMKSDANAAKTQTMVQNQK
jgi:hypothetical protein